MKTPNPARVAQPFTLPAGTELHRLHDVDYPGASFNPCKGEPTRRGASLIVPRRDLTLVPLFTPELVGWGLEAATVFSSNASSYVPCRGLALQAWRDNPAADGLIWSSVRDNSAQAMLIFEGRAEASDFELHSIREVRAEPVLLDEIADAGRRAGFTIIR
jgi:hypothetical protein